MPSRPPADLVRRAAPRLLRAVARRRLLLAAAAAAASVGFAVSAVAPPRPVTVSVLVAAHDLAGGQVLAQSDVAVRRVPPAAVPDGALTGARQVVGEVLAGPARRGEALTDLRLLGEALLAGYGAGTVAVAVRVADAGALRLVRSGDLVDLHAATPAPDGSSAEVSTVAAGVRVVTVPAEEPGAGDGGLLVVATPPAVAERLAGASATARISLVMRGR